MPPYDPECQFNMSSLTRLEAANIPVVTALSPAYMQLASAAEVTLDKDTKQKMMLGVDENQRLETLIEQWQAGRSQLPPTWRSLKDALRKMNMEILSQQIKSFYFDFNEFLPDEIYHRLICLISTVAKPLSTKLCHHYSRQQCFFTGVLGTKMIIQMDEAQQRLEIKFM